MGKNKEAKKTLHVEDEEGGVFEFPGADNWDVDNSHDLHVYDDEDNEIARFAGGHWANIRLVEDTPD